MKLNEILDVYRRGDFMSLALIKERRAVVREVSKRYKRARQKQNNKEIWQT